MTSRVTTAGADRAPRVVSAARPGILRALQVLAGLLVLLVLNQAFLAGRGQFVDRDFLEIHGRMGALILLPALVQLVLALLAGIRGRWRRPILGISVLLLGLLPLQLGLGYAGRESGEAAAWHLPNGVLIFGLAVTNLWLTIRAGRAR